MAHITEPTQKDEAVTNLTSIEADLVSEDPVSGENPPSETLTDDSYEPEVGFAPPAETMALESAGPEALTATNLRDIGEASFGPPPPQLETVHGFDDRVKITQTGQYPWRVHASLRLTAADDSLWIGTGWFIGPRILVTAGHVVHIFGSGVPGRDGWIKRAVVMPGRNGTDLPYGPVTSTRFYSVKGWTDSGDDEYDYGAIILNEPLGNQTGWFGFGAFANLDGVRGNISGYPGDKPPGTQWYDSRVIDSTNPRKVFYDIDTAGGQSGSACYRIKNGQRYGIAIHAYGGSRVNSGTRINKHVFDNLKAWKEASEN